MTNNQNAKTSREIQFDVIEYTLPESFLYVLEYGSDDEKEISILKRFLDCEFGDKMFTVGPAKDEANFCKYHDLKDYGWLADNCVNVDIAIQK